MPLRVRDRGASGALIVACAIGIGIGTGCGAGSNDASRSGSGGGSEARLDGGDDPLPDATDEDAAAAPDSDSGGSGPTVKPGAGNSGVPGGVTLAAYAGPCTITTAGTVVDGADVTCNLVIAAPDVTVRRSRLREGFVVRETTGATIEDSTSDTGVAISSSKDVTLARNDIHGPGDGLHITSDGSAHCENILVEGNWIHAPEIGPGDHYDVLQVRGVKNLTLRGNNLDAGIWIEVGDDGGTNAVVFFENANGGNDTCTVEGNWLNGGGYMIYTSAANTSFTKNRVGRDFHFGLLYDPFAPFVESGNVWDDDGTPVTLQQ